VLGREVRCNWYRAVEESGFAMHYRCSTYSITNLTITQVFYLHYQSITPPGVMRSGDTLATSISVVYFDITGTILHIAA